MRLSDDKITHLTHVILKGLLEKDLIDPLAEEGKIRREIRRSIVQEINIFEELDSKVRNKLQSYSKKIPEGSPEWEVLYQKFFHEEAARKGKV